MFFVLFSLFIESMIDLTVGPLAEAFTVVMQLSSDDSFLRSYRNGVGLG